MAKAKTRRDVPGGQSTNYPEPFRAFVAGRTRHRLGDAFGLTQFGVNLTELAPGAATSLRHWHTAEDEFVYVLDGELTLRTDAGEEVLTAGSFVGYKAGVEDGHHLVNRSDRPALLLEIGSRMPGRDAAFYPDVDLHCPAGDGPRRFTHKDGTPY